MKRFKYEVRGTIYWYDSIEEFKLLYDNIELWKAGYFCEEESDIKFDVYFVNRGEDGWIIDTKPTQKIQ